MNKFLIYTFLISFLSSCAGEILSPSTTYKKLYKLEFENFERNNGLVWDGEEASYTSDEKGYNLNFGKTPGDIIGVFKVTYVGSNILRNNPLSFEKLGINDHYKFDISDCSRKALRKDESCNFKIIYKYSDSDDINLIDRLSFIIKDEDNNTVTYDDLFLVNLSGHRKVKGSLSIDEENLDFGTNDFNVEPEAHTFNISYSGEFNIENIEAVLSGNDNLKSLFDLSEIECINNTSCEAKVRFPALTIPGTAYGIDALNLKYKIMLQGADDYEELGDIKLEGKRRTETNLVIYDENDNPILETINFDDLSDEGKSKVLFVKNIGETKTSNFNFNITNSEAFSIDASGTSCQNGNVLQEDSQCSIKINFTKTDPELGTYQTSLNVSSDRIETRTVNFSGKVYVPAAISIEPSGVVDLGSVVAVENVPNTLFSTAFITLKKSIGEVPATISSLELNDDNFSIDNTWVSTEKCNVGTILNNVNDVCLIKVVFNPEIQANYPQNLGAILNFSYNNGKNVILLNNNVNLIGLALKDAELSFDTNVLDFETIIKDETKTLDLNITNTGGIDIQANFELINNTNFSISNNNCINVIEPNETCNVSLLFNPNNVKSTFSSSLKVEYTNASSIVIESQIALIANSINPAILSINPDLQDFGQHRFNIDDPIQKEFTVINIGDLDATEISSAIINSFEGSFEILDSSTCENTLAKLSSSPNNTCLIVIKFDPPIHISEVLNTNLNINYKDRPSAVVSTSVSSEILGEAISYANLELSSGDGDFGDVLINNENSILLSFTNNGYSKAVISNLSSSSQSITIDTSVLDSCEIGTEVEVFETCNIKLTFNPTDGSNLAFNDLFVLTYTSYDISTDINVNLIANVLVPAKLEILPQTYTFLDTEEGSSSVDISFEIKLTEGTTSTEITSISLEDTSNFTFTDINNCLDYVFDTDNTTCTILVKFNPQLIQGPNGNLSFNSILSIQYERGYEQGLGSSDLTLNGNSIESNAVLSSTNEPLVFEARIRGTQSQAQTITINKLSGNHNAVITNIEVLEDNSGHVNFIVDYNNSTCEIGSLIDEACNLSLIFSPSIENTDEISVTSSIKIFYNNRSTYANDITELELENILEGEVKLETIIEIENVNLGNITQGNNKDFSLILNMTQGLAPFLQNEDQSVEGNVMCSGEIVTSFNIVINTNIETCTFANGFCELNLSVLDVPATEGLFNGACDEQYDILIANYVLEYNNGLESPDGDVVATATISGNSLTPAKLVFNQVGEPFTRNLNEYFCYNYTDPYNNGPEICQIDVHNENPDDLIYNGAIIGTSMTYGTSNDNLKLENIGETNAIILDDYLEENSFRYNLNFGAAKFITINGFNYNTGIPYERNISEISFFPTIRYFQEYIIGIRYQNGLEINNEPVVLNTKDDNTITDAQKKLVLSATGLRRATLKLQSIDENGNLIDCSGGGNLCQFNNGEDIVYYKDDFSNYVIKNNLNTDQLFALVYDDGDVPARLEDPENNSPSLGNFYYKDYTYGTNSDCEVGDYMFIQDGDNIKEYCFIDLSFEYSDGDTTYCGYKETKNKIYQYYPYVSRIMPPYTVKSHNKDQVVWAGIRPALSFEDGYCDFDFGLNNSEKTLTLKNYSNEDILIDLNNPLNPLNSYYENYPLKGDTQNDFFVNSSTCDNLLSVGDTCDIDITFARDVEANGHAKFDYYNYRIPFSILDYTNNFDVELEASTFEAFPTFASNYLKTTKYDSNAIATYYCFDCDNSSIDVNLSNYTQVPILFTSAKISIRNNWNFLTNNNNLFNFSIDGSSFANLDLTPAPYFTNGEINYSMKVKNVTTFISNLSSYSFDWNHNFNTFYGFTNASKTYQFKLTFSSAYDVISFFNGEMQNHLTAEGNQINGSGMNSFIISKNQLIDMCYVMDDKLFLDPTNPIFGQVQNFLTQDFKQDCCSDELGIAGLLAPEFCN